MTHPLIERLKAWPLYVLPHHLLSRLVLWLTRRESRFTPAVIRRFARAFNVEMNDAAEPDLNAYPTFNQFFTRALRPEARPIAPEAATIVSPADGRVSALGRIDAGTLLQAKGQSYSLVQLLAGDNSSANRLHNGHYLTVYLSPRDYHRLHMPLSGQLQQQTHVPGRLFGVAPHVLRHIPSVFARNERVVVNFETEAGLMVLVLVGAINVAAIETVWHGLVTPPQRRAVSRIDYVGEQQITLERGAEMGRFNMGSTIIVLMEKPVMWDAGLDEETPLKMGQSIGNIS